MNDYERRIELLSQREKMSTTSFDTMDGKPVKRVKSTLGMRITVCILCFIGYILLDYGNLSIMNFNSKAVTNQIKSDISISKLKAFYK